MGGQHEKYLWLSILMMSVIIAIALVSCGNQEGNSETDGADPDHALSTEETLTQLFDLDIDVSQYVSSGEIVLELKDMTSDNLKCQYTWLDVHLFKLVDDKWDEVEFIREIEETEPPKIVVGEEAEKAYSQRYDLQKQFGDLPSGTYMIVVDARIYNEYGYVTMAITPSVVFELPER